MLLPLSLFAFGADGVRYSIVIFVTVAVLQSSLGVTIASGVASLPRDEDGPVFKEPWEAQAFAMTLRLYDGGHFTWPEWAECLAEEIEAAQKKIAEAHGYEIEDHSLVIYVRPKA